MDYVHIVTEALKDNQFFKGGLVLGIIGAAAAYFRGIPRAIYAFIRGRILISVTIYRRNLVYNALTDWIDGHKQTRKKANLELAGFTTKSDDDAYYFRGLSRSGNAWEGPKSKKPVYTVSWGVHYYRVEGASFWIGRVREQAQLKSADETDQLIMTTFRWNRKILNSIIEAAYQKAFPESDRSVSVWTRGTHEWNHAYYQKPRDLTSLAYEEGLLEDVVDDLNTFISSADWYTKVGIPYQRGYLLYGPPGTGKTSLIHALSTHFKKDIYVLTFTGKTDEEILASLTEVSDNSFVVIEDIDALFKGRELVVKDAKYTFSGFINAIGGLVSKPGQILFLTTNHIENLDPALIRAGRVDKKVFVGLAGADQAEKIFLNIFPDNKKGALEFKTAYGDKKMAPAHIVNYLIQYRDDHKKALDNIKTLLKEGK